MEPREGRQPGRGIAALGAVVLGIAVLGYGLLASLIEARADGREVALQDAHLGRLVAVLRRAPEADLPRLYPDSAWALLDAQGQVLRHAPQDFVPSQQIRDALLLRGEVRAEGRRYLLRGVTEGNGGTMLLASLPDPASRADPTPLLLWAILAGLLGLPLLLSAWLGSRALRRAARLHRDEADSSRSREAFLSSISHEFRTPLTNIFVFADLLAQGGVPDAAELEEFAQIIRVEVLRLRRLVDDAMEYTQAVGAGDRAGQGVVDLAAVLEPVLEEYEAPARAARLQIQSDLSGGPYLVAAGHAELAGIVGRVLDNAIKFSPAEGRVRVVLSPYQGGCLLAVDDEGPGVPEAERRRVLLPLVQLGDLMTNKPAGTGLGLSFCNQVMSTLGGRIWLEDSDLGGLRVCLSWPAPDPAALQARGLIRIGRPAL